MYVHRYVPTVVSQWLQAWHAHCMYCTYMRRRNIVNKFMRIVAISVNWESGWQHLWCMHHRLCWAIAGTYRLRRGRFHYLLGCGVKLLPRTWEVQSACMVCSCHASGLQRDWAFVMDHQTLAADLPYDGGSFTCLHHVHDILRGVWRTQYQQCALRMSKTWINPEVQSRIKSVKS